MFVTRQLRLAESQQNETPDCLRRRKHAMALPPWLSAAAVTILLVSIVQSVAGGKLHARNGVCPFAPRIQFTRVFLQQPLAAQLRSPAQHIVHHLLMFFHGLRWPMSTAMAR